MTTLTIRPAVPEDARNIALRYSDLVEGSLWVPGSAASAVLASSIEHATEAFTAEDADGLIAIGGFTVEGSEVWPWLMCSDRIETHGKGLLRFARGMLARIRAEHPQRLICNYLHRPNQAARAFITHLGFRVVPAPGHSKFDIFYLPPCASLS